MKSRLSGLGHGLGNLRGLQRGMMGLLRRYSI